MEHYAKKTEEADKIMMIIKKVENGFGMDKAEVFQ